MERLAHSISEKIAVQFNYSNDKKDVITYGLIALFQLFVIGIIIISIGILFRMAYESIVVFLGISILKKSTGGAHSISILNCTTISIVVILVMAAASRYLLGSQINLLINISITAVVFIITLFIFHKRVPVDSPNKPIVTAVKISKLRKQSFIFLTLYIFTSIVLNYFASNEPRLISISYSILFATVWQAFMLTKYGALLIKKIDTKFKKEVHRN